MVRWRSKRWGWMGLAFGLLVATSPLITSSGQAAEGAALSLEVSPGATYRIERVEEELTLAIRNNRINLQSQIDRLRDPRILNALVLGGRRAENIIRLQLAPGVVVSDRLTRNPSRIMLSLMPPSASLEGGRSLVRKVMRTPFEALQAALEGPDVPLPDPAVGPDLLFAGSRVRYPVPLPAIPITLTDWRPVRPSFGSGQDADLIQIALELLGKGDARQALVELDKFEKRYPQSPSLSSVRMLTIEAKLELALEQPTARMEALEQLKRALRSAPKDPARGRALFLAGRCYLDLQYFAEAAAMFRDALSQVPARTPARAPLLLALALAETRRRAPEAALTALLEVVPMLDPQKQGQVILAIAAVLAQQGQYRRVLKVLDIVDANWRSLASSSTFVLLEAESLYRLNRFAESRPAFERLQTLMGIDPPRIYSFRIGECLMMEKRYQEARRLFIPSTSRIPPESARWIEAMQKLRIHQIDLSVEADAGRRKVLVDQLRQLRLDTPFAPVTEEVALELVKYHVRLGDLGEAIGQLRMFLAANKGHAHRRAVVNVVWIQIQKQIQTWFKEVKYFELLALYELVYPVVMEEGVYDIATAYTVARSYMSLSLYEKAYESVSEAFFLESASRTLSDNALLLMAECLRELKRYDEARRILGYLRGRKTQGSDSAARATLEDAHILEAEGKLVEAIEAYRRYAQLETRGNARGNALSRAASLITATRGCKAALPDLLELSQRVKPLADAAARGATAEVYYKLGECQYALDRFDDAAGSLIMALSRDGKHASSSFARYTLGRCYEALHRDSEAQILFRVLAGEHERRPEDTWVRLAQEALDQYAWKKNLTSIN